MRAVSLVWVVCCFVLLGHVFLFASFTIDDAFISFRYSENFAAGHGLVFNIDERVEGYSNFLWVVIIGLLKMAGVDVVVAAKLLGLASLAAVIAAVFGLVRAITRESLCAAGAVAWMVTSFGLVYYTVSGMETVFFAAWLTWGGYLFFQNGCRVTIGLSLVAAAAALTRPEGVMLFPVLAAFALARHRRISLRLIGAGAVFSLALAGFLSWRYLYYGHFLPNTYYAKPPTTSSNLPPVVSGFDDIFRCFFSNGGAVLLACVVLLLLNRQVRARLYPLLPIPLVVIVFQLYSGGDWMESYRFLVPLIPVYIVIGICGFWWLLNQLAVGRKKQLFMAGVFVVGLFNVAESATFYLKRDSYPNFVMTSSDLIPAAKWVGDHYPPDYTIVCWRIGALAYYSGLNLIDDEWGLTDEYVAHSKHRGHWNASVREDYLFERNPELIMTGARQGACLDEKLMAGKRTYRLVRHFRQGSAGWWVLYEREDLRKFSRAD